MLKFRNIAAESAANEPRRVAVLAPELANQIAAGEVVERPSSVVKELVENSLDAGSKRVEVTIENGGRDLIRVEDDGCGMRREDALRALERHATSKIEAVDDLFRIASLGFRGEAVPSIGSVSRMEIRTKPRGDLSGTRILVEGGIVREIEDVGMAAGTVITVERLFFNTPARLKFLKSAGTETRHTTEALVRLGLSRPDVRFLFRKDGKARLDLAPVDDLKDRVLEVLGRDVYDDLYPTFEYPAVNGIVCRGYFSRPGHDQRSAANVYTFVNGRYVVDRTIRAALKGAYGTMLEKNRHPSVVLFVEVPFELVDINVHPTKTEVRFHDTNSLYRAVFHSVADQLAQAPWLDEAGKKYSLRRRPEAATDGRAMLRPEDATFEPLNSRYRRLSQLSGGGAWGQASPDPMLTPGYSDLLSPYYRPPDADQLQQGFAAPGAAPLGEPPRLPISEAMFEPHDGQGPVNYFSSLRVIGQFKRMYIVCEDRSGLVIIDQHAAHERIAFERLKEIFENDHKEAQPLLFPQRLELDAMRADTLEDNLDFFERAGFEIEPFGGTTFALKAVPAVLKRASAEPLIRDAVDDLSTFGRSDRVAEAMESVLSRMACHSVVRGPTSLTIEECEGLLRQMDEIDFKANCPHGRPVYYRIPLDELEISFGRT